MKASFYRHLVRVHWAVVKAALVDILWQLFEGLDKKSSTVL